MAGPASASIVVGLSFGDEGKGSLTDYLTRLRGASLVVRFSGGPQAAHNVVTPGGRHHTFAQFGSGTLAGAETYLSRHMLIEPYALLNEADALAEIGATDALSGLTVDVDAPVITPYHWMANRVRELARGEARHGSCGFGVGELRSDQLAGHDDGLRAGELGDSTRVLRKLARVRERKYEELKHLDVEGTPASKAFNDMLRDYPPLAVCYFYRNFLRGIKTGDRAGLARRLQSETTIFEGAQGVLLDEIHGFAPYNSWTNCTFDNALELASDAGIHAVKIGVLRAYSTRHGAGPFPAEDARLSYPEPHNGAHPWQGPFRLGHFDAVMARYALRVVEVIDELAVTHLDAIRAPFSWIPGYEGADGEEISDIPLEPGGPSVAQLNSWKPVVWRTKYSPVSVIEEALDEKVVYISRGATAEEKFMRGGCQFEEVMRAWE